MLFSLLSEIFPQGHGMAGLSLSRTARGTIVAGILRNEALGTTLVYSGGQLPLLLLLTTGSGQ